MKPITVFKLTIHPDCIGNDAVDTDYVAQVLRAAAFRIGCGETASTLPKDRNGNTVTGMWELDREALEKEE